VKEWYLPFVREIFWLVAVMKASSPVPTAPQRINNVFLMVSQGNIDAHCAIEFPRSVFQNVRAWSAALMAAVVHVAFVLKVVCVTLALVGKMECPVRW